MTAFDDSQRPAGKVSASGGPPRPPKKTALRFDDSDDDDDRPESRDVRVINDRKEDPGIMSVANALKLARSRSDDLIEIDATAVPPLW